MSLSGEYVEKLRSIDSYQVAVHKLMNRLNLKNYEADQLLYIQLTEHRLKTFDEEVLLIKIDEQDVRLKWAITYACRDVTRREYADRKKQENIKQSEVINLDRPDRLTEHDLNSILNLIPKLFKNHFTAQWCISVLEYGEIETRENFNMTKRQFSDKLYQVELYCKKHREKMVNMVLSKQQQDFLEEESTLRKFIETVEREDFRDEDFNELIEEHYEFIDDVIGCIPRLQQPKLLLEDFKACSSIDKYKLVNRLYGRLDELERRMIEQ